MAKQPHVVTTQPEKKNGRKPEPAVLPEKVSTFAGVATFPNGLLGANGDGKIEKQAGRLADTRLQVAQRRVIAGQIGRTQGNTHLQRVMMHVNLGRGMVRRSLPAVQREPTTGQKGKGGNGSGPGRLQNAAERPYNVTGSTLAEVGPQLQHFGGYAAETNAPITISGPVQPQRQEDGTYQIRVQWVIRGAYTGLPRWTGYNNACPAAQQEWDRFMTQVRAHEQQAHVDAAIAFVNNLGEEDTLITGSSVADVRSNLQAKQQELAGRLQAIHDGCTHGTDIDAILHPENGVCE